MKSTLIKQAFLGCVIFVLLWSGLLLSQTLYRSKTYTNRTITSSSILLKSVSEKNIKCPNVSLSQKPLPLTVLVSFPGSGNTWTRHLLEQMSGIATGSEYSDKKLEAGGFIGERKMDTSTIAVKTHGLYKPLSGKPLRDIKRAILIIRNPYKAMVADFHRQQSKNHVGSVSLPYFIKGWKNYLSVWTKRWLALNRNWITLMDNLLVIFYENLVSHLEGELTRLYSFLDDGSIHGNIQCALHNSEGNFHRNTSKELPISFFYNEDDVRLLNSHIDNISILLKKYNHSFFEVFETYSLLFLHVKDNMAYLSHYSSTMRTRNCKSTNSEKPASICIEIQTLGKVCHLLND